MSQTFREFVVGGILVSPFVAYAGVALLAFLLLRLILARAGLLPSDAPPIAFLALYVAILATVILLV